MALETRLLQKLSQNLLMTPQLQQAIKLLLLNRQEYKEALERELLENPVLEEAPEESQQQNTSPQDNSSDNENDGRKELPVDESEIPPASSETLFGDENSSRLEEFMESISDARELSTPRGLFDFEDKPQFDATLTKAQSLQDFLISQIRLLEVPKEDQFIIYNIIGNMDKNGYLRSELEEISIICKRPVEDVQRILEFIQSLDPPGVGSRTLKECLLIQLAQLGLAESLSAIIVEKHLDKLERKRFDLISKEEKAPLDEVYRAVSIIRGLEPYPGRPFSDEAPRYIVPDIYVTKDGESYVITLNEDGLPKLRISPYYLDMLRNKDANKAYLNDRLKAASWLIRSIHQRQSTIYRVAESIMKHQREFLDYGISKLKPLVLKDVADDIGMHESTVSRVTTNKFVHTPQGVFELKFFFSNGIRTSTGGEMSSSSIKEKIRALISTEDPHNPISDQKIVDVLRAENIDIARRTVAKYRENLNIPPSSRRKQLF